MAFFSIQQDRNLIEKLTVLLADNKINTGAFTAAMLISRGLVRSCSELAAQCAVHIDTATRWVEKLWENDLVTIKNGEVANLPQCMILDVVETKKTYIQTDSHKEVLNDKPDNNTKYLEKLHEKSRKIAFLSGTIADLLNCDRRSIEKVLTWNLANQDMREENILYIAQEIKKELNPAERPIDPETNQPDVIRNVVGYLDGALKRALAGNVSFLQAWRKKRSVPAANPKLTELQTKYNQCKQAVVSHQDREEWKQAFTTLFDSADLEMAEGKLSQTRCLALAEFLKKTIEVGKLEIETKEYEINYTLLQEAVGLGIPNANYIQKTYRTLAEQKKVDQPKHQKGQESMNNLFDAWKKLS